MPFKSEAQRRWMYANKPEMAEQWEKETPKGKLLPDKLKKKAKKKEASIKKEIGILAAAALSPVPGPLPIALIRLARKHPALWGSKQWAKKAKELSKTGSSKQQIHALADKLSIPWDNNRAFMSWTKGITGKAHLDDMTKDELSSVYSALKKRGKEKTAAKATVKAHTRKDKSGRLTRVKEHKREYAKGIPKKNYFAKVPTTNKPGNWEYVVQRHLAHRAGEHFDLRLAPKGKAHSWALRRLPGPGEKVLAVQQPTHTREYMDWEGIIPSGYGAGKVGIEGRGKVEVMESTANKVIFNKHDGRQTREYALIRTGGKNWLLINRTTTEGKYKYPQSKDKYRSEKYNDTLALKDGIMQPKVDGAHALVVLQAGKRPRVFGYRKSKRGDVLEYTHKIPGLFQNKVPKGTKATVLRAEVYLADKNGKALPAQRTAAILNSGVQRARNLQEGTGGLQILPFDVVGSNRSYEEKYNLVKELSSRMPFLRTPDIAVSTKDKQRMVKDIRNGKHPLTREGVVLWSNKGPTKAKITEDADVYVRKVFEGDGKYAGHAGGFYYSRTPNGPIVGKVGTGLSDAMRRDLWKSRGSLSGKVATIKFEKELPSGAFFAPVFTRWHPDKN